MIHCLILSRNERRLGYPSSPFHIAHVYIHIPYTLGQTQLCSHLPFPCRPPSRYIDEDQSGIPEEVLGRNNIRFVFICSESHTRQRRTGVPSGWYQQCSNFTLLLKPVKRRPLWKALISSGQVQVRIRQLHDRIQ